MTTQLPNNHIAVTVGSHQVHTCDGEKLYILYSYGGYIGEDAVDPDEEVFDLPPGQWSIVGLGSELTGAQWKQIVREYIYSGKISFYAYEDYSGKQPECEDDIISDPTESGLSLFTSLGLKPSTTLILKQL